MEGKFLIESKSCKTLKRIFFISSIFFVIASIVFLFVAIATIGLVRPILLKKMNTKENATGLEDKYIGKIAKVVQEITKSSGRVAIYGEEWQAKLPDTQDENIPVGEEVKIVSNDSIIFTVEKIKEN